VSGRRALAVVVLVGCWTLATGQAISQPATPPAPTAAQKQVVARGEVLFGQHCAMCHEPAIEGAPSQADLGEYNPQTIVEILRQGPMKPMAKDLSDTDIDAINSYLHGG